MAKSVSMRGSAIRYQSVWLSRRKVTMPSSRILARCWDSADWEPGVHTLTFRVRDYAHNETTVSVRVEKTRKR